MAQPDRPPLELMCSECGGNPLECGCGTTLSDSDIETLDHFYPADEPPQVIDLRDDELLPSVLRWFEDLGR